MDAQARLSAYIPDEAIDQLLGYPDAAHGGITASSQTRLSGSLERRARAAIDGDPSTSWDTTFAQQEGHHIDITVAQPTTFDHLDMQLVNDGRHSVPTRLLLVVDGDTDHPIPVSIPDVPDQSTPNATVNAPVQLPQSVTGTSFAFYVDGVREVKTRDWYSGDPITMPIGIAELGIPGVQSPPEPATFDSGCRSDLLTVDDTPVPLRVSGNTHDALQREKLDVTPCGDDPTGVVNLAAGEHVVRTGIGRDLGIDIDRLLFSSASGGAPGPITVAGDDIPSGPPVSALNAQRVSYDADVQTDGSPFWVSVGQSWNEGWRATADGHDLGAPQVIDGYGSGWLVHPDQAGTVHIAVHWTPQRLVWVSLALSALGVVICLLVLAFGWRRRRRRDASARPSPPMIRFWYGRDVKGPSWRCDRRSCSRCCSACSSS